MIDLGNVAAYGVIAFALGTFWYELLRRTQTDKLRLTAISFFGIIVAEAVVAEGVFVGGPIVLGLHPFAALIASFAAVYIDIAWQERKIWPWAVIEDLQQLARPFKLMKKVKVSVGGEEAGENQTTERIAA